MIKKQLGKNVKIFEGTLADIENRVSSGCLISPICPDYLFEEKKVNGNEKERVHDFSGLGTDVGIVYEKLIGNSERLLRTLKTKNPIHKHYLLVADVEVEDRVILDKLTITKKEFVKKCEKTTRRINQDLKKRGLNNSKAVLMSEFFKSNKYPFFQRINVLKKRLVTTKDKKINQFVKSAQITRYPLHKFWFDLSKNKSFERTIYDISMYASFGHCPLIDKSVILCADSEVLSKSYNLFKRNITPVIYISGKY